MRRVGEKFALGLVLIMRLPVPDPFQTSGLLPPGEQSKARAEAIIMKACSHNFLYFSVRYPEVVRLFTKINFFFFFSGKRLHSLERSPLFTAILDFLYSRKKPERLTQPTHGVPLKSHFLFPSQSKGSAWNDHHKWPWHAHTQTACAAIGVPMAT